MSVLNKFLAEPMRRVLSVASVDSAARTVELAFSSDVELERWPGVAEKLSHAPGACDLSRLNDRANLLFNHDPDAVLGVVESARIDADGFGRAVVRFGKSEDAEEAWQDVQDGILTKVSVGYRITEVKLLQESESGPDVYEVRNWQPYEISLVTIPADPSVGVGRNLQTQNFMSEQHAQNTPAQPAPAVAPVEPKISIEAERSAGRQAEQDRVKSILAAGKQYGMNDAALRAIEEGRSIDQARELFLEEMNKRNSRVADGAKPIGLSEKEARSFSFVRLLRALTEPTDRGAQNAAAFELDACTAAAERVNHREIKGTMIPSDVLLQPLMGQRGTNTISIASGAGYTGTAGNTVQTTLLASSFIDLLRNRTVLMQLGTEMGGLVGNFDIPRQTTGTKGYWVGEDANVPKEDIDFGLLQLRPKTVGSVSEITRRTMMQSSLSVEALVRADLARGLSQTIDLAGFYGDGTGAAPVGIRSTAGVNTVTFATAAKPTFAELVQMETEIALDNADVAAMAYVANAGFRGHAKTSRRLSTSTDSMALWEPGGTVNGYRTEITNQVANGHVFFGNFADFMLAIWGGVELTVNPYSGARSGRVEVVAMQDVDFGVRRAASFCFGNVA
jgi:HK97 family phage major capsid protein/HK97 family phage prohead protease